MKIAFLMDRVEDLELYKDTSCFLIGAAMDRGHEVFYVNVDDVFVGNGVPVCHAWRPELTYDAEGKLRRLDLVDEKVVELSGFDVILNRKDPPFDMNYIYLTYILDLVKDEVFVLNDPSGVRSANEKFWAMNFAGVIPDTLVTRRKSDVLEFLERHKDAGIVLKPLDGKGGEGVLRLTSDDVNRNQLAEMMTGDRYVMAQEFLKEIKEGDKRIVILDGEPISAFVRIPSADDFRGNISAGATSKSVILGEADRALVSSLAPFLKENGLWLVGLDVIGGKVTEINVTSPIIGFDHHPENGEKIIEFLEDKVV